MWKGGERDKGYGKDERLVEGMKTAYRGRERVLRVGECWVWRGRDAA